MIRRYMTALPGGIFPIHKKPSMQRNASARPTLKKLSSFDWFVLTGGFVNLIVIGVIVAYWFLGA